MIYKVTPYGSQEQFGVEEANLEDAVNTACGALTDRGTIPLEVQPGLYLPIAVATGQTYPMFHIEVSPYQGDGWE